MQRIRDIGRRVSGSPAAVTALLTIVLADVFALIVVFARVDTRNARMEHRSMPVIDVWRAMLDNLPSQAPGVFSREVLIVMLIVAMFAFAYVLVATWRLPSEVDRRHDDPE